MPRLRANNEPQVRLGFQLLASDNPLLVAELLKVRKGRSRHARLVTLATIGLLMESRFVAGEAPPHAAVGDPAAHGGGDGDEQILPMTDEEFVDIN